MPPARQRRSDETGVITPSSLHLTGAGGRKSSPYPGLSQSWAPDTRQQWG